MLRKPRGQSLEAGEDYAAEPFLAVSAASHIRDGWLTVPGLAPALTEYAARRWPDHGILMRLASPGPASLRLMGVTSPKASWWGQNLPRFLVTVRGHENHVLFDWPVKPRDGVYCRLVDGHLTYGGQRLRLWGVCRGASHNPLQALRV
jgi:hypothetical protein